MDHCIELLICPVCDGALRQVGQTLQCPQAHSFDIAREGYVNLMIGHRRPKISGDTKDMLRARRAFLEQGYYQSLSDSLNQRAGAFLADAGYSEPAIVDVGCGEAYYLDRLKQHLDALRADVCSFGIDSSKSAAQMAAGRYGDLRLVVANVNRKLPFATRSIMLMTNIFAPRNVDEFDRVLAQECMLLIVIPTPNHLAAIREEFGLLGIEPDKKQNIVRQFAPAFRLLDEQILEYDLHLNADALRALVQMTPSNWHLDAATRKRLATYKGLYETTAGFHILVFSR